MRRGRRLSALGNLTAAESHAEAAGSLGGAICGREDDALSSRLSASMCPPASSTTMHSGLNPARRPWASAVSMHILQTIVNLGVEYCFAASEYSAAPDITILPAGAGTSR
jgi:hypothetical protein